MFGGIPAAELNELKDYWKAFPDLKEALFEQTASDYYKLSVGEVKKAIKQNKDILAFENRYADAFAGMKPYLYQELISNMMVLNISKTEQLLSDDKVGS